MTQFTIPQSVSQNISRAKSLLKRDEPLKALDALITGLELYDPSKLMGKARFEAEVLINECVTELNRQPNVRSLLKHVAKSDKAEIMYSPGQEHKLKLLLPIVRKGLRESHAAKIQHVEDQKEQRKTSLEQKGLAYLREKDYARGKATLRRLADEFGEEQGVLVQVGEWLAKEELYFEAVEFLEQSIETFPKVSKAYALAASSYKVLREFDKAEAVYVKAIKQFGKHTKTLTNLASLYMDWNKKDKAFEAAEAALALDKNNTEAKEIFEKLA